MQTAANKYNRLYGQKLSGLMPTVASIELVNSIVSHSFAFEDISRCPIQVHGIGDSIRIGGMFGKRQWGIASDTSLGISSGAFVNVGANKTLSCVLNTQTNDAFRKLNTFHELKTSGNRSTMYNTVEVANEIGFLGVSGEHSFNRGVGANVNNCHHKLYAGIEQGKTAGLIEVEFNKTLPKKLNLNVVHTNRRGGASYLESTIQSLGICTTLGHRIRAGETDYVVSVNYGRKLWTFDQFSGTVKAIKHFSRGYLGGGIEVDSDGKTTPSITAGVNI